LAKNHKAENKAESAKSCCVAVKEFLPRQTAVAVLDFDSPTQSQKAKPLVPAVNDGFGNLTIAYIINEIGSTTPNLFKLKNLTLFKEKLICSLR